MNNSGNDHFSAIKKNSKIDMCPSSLILMCYVCYPNRVKYFGIDMQIYSTRNSKVIEFNRFVDLTVFSFLYIHLIPTDFIKKIVKQKTYLT